MATISVTGKGSEITSRNKRHAEEKFGKLKRYYGGISRIEAVLVQGNDGAEVELVISIKRAKPLVCHTRAQDLYSAIDLVIDKAEGKLTRYKERHKDHRTESASSATAPQAGPDDEENLESFDDVVEGSDFTS